MNTTAHVFIATSLDGFIARPDGGIDWLEMPGTDEDHGYTEFISDKDALIMGRGTFESICDFRPWPYTLPVFVLSKTLSEVPDDLKDSVEIAPTEPKQTLLDAGTRGWHMVYLDGGQVIQSFLSAGLVTDMIITRLPILLGEGRPLFGPLPGDVVLRHEWTKTFRSGLVQSRYRMPA